MFTIHRTIPLAGKLTGPAMGIVLVAGREVNKIFGGVNRKI
ncbi:MAG: hypothetical protein PHN17_08785 [Syntrophaceticus sp.]|nr:hypothetical protein [Syntrophaceticus sp.]